MASRAEQPLRPLVKSAQAEAQALGAKAIEAEHLLLALAAQPDTAAGSTLQQVGLSHDRLVRLLDDERARSLAFVGIDTAALELPVAPKTRGRLPLATSSKQALARVVANAGRRRDKLTTTELLRAVVSVEAGTVTRLLALAGTDRADLAARLEGRRS
ncbi:MAG: Clp protease N-terminal domain-containing protein [Streptosporangiales bacterium]